MPEVGGRVAIARLPGGMVTNRPKLNIEPGRMSWIENYDLSGGSYRSRRGFEKYSHEAIPKSGIRLDGSTQYLEISKGETVGDTTFQQASTANLVCDLSFIIEESPETVGDKRWLFTVSDSTNNKLAVGLTVDANERLQMTVEVGGSSLETTLTDATQIKPGIGYRVVVIKDSQLGSGLRFQIVLMRQGSNTVLANVNGDVANLTANDYVAIGRSFVTGAFNYFKGIIQEFRWYQYASGSGGSTTMNSEWSFTNSYDAARARFDHELTAAEIANTALKCYLKLDQATGRTFSDETGNGYDAYMRPAPPLWVEGGLVDNAPKTYVPELDVSQGHHITAYDIPAALGGGGSTTNSILDQFRNNTDYEFTVSMAVKIDSDYIDLMAASAGGAPDILPLFYYGDAGASGLGVDIVATGKWGCAIWLENTGTGAAPTYMVRCAVHDGTTKVTRFTTAAHTVVPGTKYRIDVIRSAGRYLYARLYKNGEKFYAGDGEELRADIGAGWASQTLDQQDYTSNGAVMLFGTFLDSTQHYFPGQIDDIRVYSINAESLPAEQNISQHPWDKVQSGHPRQLLYLMLNEGDGVYVTDSGTYNNNRSAAASTSNDLHSLMLVSGGSATNDEETIATGAGWVKPNRYNRAAGLVGYKDIETGQEMIFVTMGGAIWACSADFGSDEVRFTPVYHGLRGNEPMRHAHVNNQVVFSDGVNHVLRHDGKSMTRVGIPAPANAMALSSVAVSSGLAAGTYKYVQTFYNSKTGGRSNPSPSFTYVVASNNSTVSLKYYTPPDGLDYDGVDMVEIWRTQAGGSTYYRIGTIRVPNRDDKQTGYSGPAGTVVAPYSDSTPDASIGNTILRDGANTTRYSRIPKCKYIVSARGRLIGIAPEGHPNRIVWCEMNYPDHHDPTFQYSDDMDGGDGDKATGAVYVNGKVFIFQRRSIWVLRGVESEDTLRLDQLYSGTGCVDQSTIQVMGGTILFRGEDNFYALEPGAAQPTPIGNDIRNTLEVVDPDHDRTGCSALLLREGIYLCAVTTIDATYVNSNVRNNYVYAFHTDTGQWAIWTVDGVGQMANIELGGRSDLFALMRFGFLYRYSTRGQNLSSGSSLLLTYVDGLSRGDRCAFTLKADVAADDEYIDVNETASVDTDGDGMKGLGVKWKLSDETLSTKYYIRKVEAITGGYRLFLTVDVASADAATQGYECFVGGFTRKIETPEFDMGDWTRQKTLAYLMVAASGGNNPPIPSKAPDCDGAAGSTYDYGYTYKTTAGESRMSPIVSSSEKTGTLTVLNPGTEIGTTPQVCIYRRESGTNFALVDTENGTTDLGGNLSWTDDGSAGSGDYDPDYENAEVYFTMQARRRLGKLRTHTEMNVLRRDFGGDDEYFIPCAMTGNVFKLTIESWIPNTYHEIQAITAIHKWEDRVA